VVEVDLETGKVTLARLVAVDDCGTVVNPMIVAGQVHGGLAQGAAQALYEEVRFDATGNPSTATLADYGMPSAAELPSFELGETVTSSPRNPLGMKGVGESGTVGATAAIHNAVVDALRPYGVRHVDMPLTPERVWRAIRDAAS
jgi:aerobic carbon-monoxide dehydrogenase large subunit